MADTLTYLGGGSLGSRMPTALAANAAALADLQAKLAGLLVLQTQLTITPPSIAMQIALAAQATAQLTAAITLPGIALSITSIATIIAQLTAQVSALLSIQASFGTVGLHAYRYSGTVAGLGGKLSAELASGLPGGAGANANSEAIILAAEDAGMIAVLQTVFA